MDYPDDFDTPIFPAGRRIAVARVMAIGAMIMFFIIVALCGLLLWAARSRRSDPFIISVDTITGEWDVVGHIHGQEDMTAAQSLQESVVINFAKNWFRISSDAAQNDARWAACSRTDFCLTEDYSPHGDECVLYCSSSDSVFSSFIYNVVPDYQERAADGEEWILNSKSVNITALSPISEYSGAWQIDATVLTNVGKMDIVAFVNVGRDVNQYPATMGYYITAFNAYRLK